MRILIATDNSPHAEVTLRLGAQLARRAGQAPTILTVVRRAADRSQAEAALARAGEFLRLEVPDLQTRVRIGDPDEQIVCEAREGAYDLLIVGERQDRGQVTRALLGSTAAHVVAHAPCSVLIAKGSGDLVHRILLCDSGASSLPVLSRFTARLAELLEGEKEVTVLHVMSQMSAGPAVNGKELRAGAMELMQEHTPEGELLERDMQALGRPGIYSRPKVRHGLVIDEILQEARSEQYDLVVIGAHRGHGWQRLLLDDLARKIILHVDRPVLVVREATL